MVMSATSREAVPNQTLQEADFVDGCFWHGCARHCRMPKSNNSSYWIPKIASNKIRGSRVTRVLRHAGWQVIRIWEHQIASSMEGSCIAGITRVLRGSRKE